MSVEMEFGRDLNETREWLLWEIENAEMGKSVENVVRDLTEHLPSFDQLYPLEPLFSIKKNIYCVIADLNLRKYFDMSVSEYTSLRSRNLFLEYDDIEETFSGATF